MYVVTDSNKDTQYNIASAGEAIWESLDMNDIGNETIRGAIVTALHWIEYQED